MVDHEHPKVDPKKNGYYNLVRHIAAVPYLLRYYAVTKDQAAITAVKKALWYASSFTKKYSLSDGTTGTYVYQYKKAKLGATGVFLHSLLAYKQITNDHSFDLTIEQCVRHLLDQELSNGEFRYYYMIDGKEVPIADNPKHFDFYYPGEALLGLASYVITADPGNPLVNKTKAKIHTALIFLIKDRFTKYAGQIPALPMDAWVAMAMERLWALPEFQLPEYRKFIYDNADKVIAQQYTIDNAPYADYPGAYFYEFGDNLYPDGSRAEGVIAALKVAEATNDQPQKEKLITALQLNCRALYFLVNTDKSVYSVPNPKKSIGGIRFKSTRQWFRIDTIAHVGNVYFDFLPFWSDDQDSRNVTIIQAARRAKK